MPASRVGARAGAVVGSERPACVDSAPVNTTTGRRGAGHQLRPNITRSTARTIGAFAACAWLLLATALPVFAHADLVSSTPKNKAVLATPPTTISLTFSEGLDRARSSFKLVGGGDTLGTGKAAADADTTMTLAGLTLAPGAYEIRWTAAATDGHIVRGTLSFTVREPTPAPTTPAPAPTAAPPTDAPTAALTDAPSPAPVDASPPASPEPLDASTSGASGSDVLLPIVAALVMVGVIGVLVLRRSRKAA